MKRFLLGWLVVAALTHGVVAAPADLTAQVAIGPGGPITRAELEVARSFAPSATEDTLFTFLAKDRLGGLRGRESGLENDRDIKWRLWLLDQTAGVPDLVQDRIADKARVSDADVRAAFEQRGSQFARPAQYSFRHIFGDTTECRTPADVAKVRERMDAAHAELLKTLGDNPQRPWKIEVAEFGRVARKASDIEGDQARVVGPFSADEPIQSVIRDTALALEPGEISPVFGTKHGFEILRLESYIPAATNEFAAVATDLRRELETTRRREAIEAFQAELLAATDQYEIYLGRFLTLLPGANREPATTTAALRVGDLEWTTDDLRDYMLSQHRRAWIESRRRELALNLVRKAFILPQLMRIEAHKAGYVDPITIQARLGIEKNAVLTQAWIEKEVTTALAAIPVPTEETLLKSYEQLKPRFLVPPQVKLAMVSFNVPELDDPNLSPAQKEFRLRQIESTMAPLLAECVQGASPVAVASGTAGLTYAENLYAIRTAFPEESWGALGSLKVGEWTARPLRGAKQVFFAQLLETIPERTRPLEEVRQSLTQYLRDAQRRELQALIQKQLIAEARAQVKPIE